MITAIIANHDNNDDNNDDEDDNDNDNETMTVMII